MKSGFVAVAGRPNVGKSTLVNSLCGEKIAITSTVPNTTRRRLFGVANGSGYQLALVDLPGFQRPMDALTERMQQTVDASFEDVDAVLLVLDARAHIGAGDRFVARRVFGLEPEFAVQSKALAANQGLYNGFLVAGLVWGLAADRDDVQLFFLACVIVAGAYGAATVNRRILLVQAVPAALAVLAVLVSR